MVQLKLWLEIENYGRLKRDFPQEGDNMTTPKKKLCWNCEGRVSLEAENCPYCAVYLGPAPNEKSGYTSFAPPYKIVEAEESQEEQKEMRTSPQEAVAEQEMPDTSIAKRDFKSVILPLTMLSAGTLFLIFGLTLYLFAEHGFLTLSWNGDQWYFYVICALPMLFYAWKLINCEKVE